jgi:polysaccharide export outer membrane protein
MAFSRRLLVWAPLLSVFLGMGCSASPLGRGFSLFPAGHKLLDTAKDMRLANAGPLAVPRELRKEPLPPYVVEPGDVLLVQPVDLDSPARLPGDQPVLTDGTINLGKYGHLIVAGKTVLEIESMVRAAVASQTKDAGFISVRIVSRQSKVFYVVGEVNAPGSFQLQGRETVLDALMAAGGLTDRASPDNIILSRPSHPEQCRVVLPVCYRNIVQLGDTTTNYQIAPGDRIFVPSRGVFESLVPRGHAKPPCDGPQIPCTLPAAHGNGCSGSIYPGPALRSPAPMETPGPVVPLSYRAIRTKKF